MGKKTWKFGFGFGGQGTFISQDASVEAGEMAQQLGTLTAHVEGPGLFPSTHIKRLKTTWNWNARDPRPLLTSEGNCTHL